MAELSAANIARVIREHGGIGGDEAQSMPSQWRFTANGTEDLGSFGFRDGHDAVEARHALAKEVNDIGVKVDAFRLGTGFEIAST